MEPKPHSVNPGEDETSRDPVTGQPWTDPVVTSVGAAGGIAAGAVAGAALGGPVGAIVGGLAGAVAGGALGHAAAEAVEPSPGDTDAE